MLPIHSFTSWKTISPFLYTHVNHNGRRHLGPIVHPAFTTHLHRPRSVRHLPLVAKADSDQRPRCLRSTSATIRCSALIHQRLPVDGIAHTLTESAGDLVDRHRPVASLRLADVQHLEGGHSAPVVVRRVRHEQLIECAEATRDAGRQTNQPQQQLLVATKLADGRQQIVQIEGFLRIEMR